MLHKLETRFAFFGLALTCVVGGVIGLVGYQQMTLAVRREAMTRPEKVGEFSKQNSLVWIPVVLSPAKQN